MNKQLSSDINIILYFDNKPIDVCQSDYLGLMGLHVNNCHKVYPKGTHLEIEVMGPNKMCADYGRVPVVVTSSNEVDIGLRLAKFNYELIERWRLMLNSVYSFEENKGSCNAVISI